ncbi:MAG: hydroxyisourate hydrolase [Acidobacteriota bacterium]
MRSPITTHVLDLAAGLPAAGVDALLEQRHDDAFVALGRGTTDDDGRIGDLLPSDHTLASGVYRLTFEIGPYLEAQGDPGFYPVASIVFRVGDPTEHYHVPLLLSPYGYSTYRGS